MSKFRVNSGIIFILVVVFFFNTKASQEKILYEFSSLNKNGTIVYSKDKVTKNALKDGEIVMLPLGYKEPKEMFRSTWVASVQNLHYPKLKDLKDRKKGIRNTKKELKEDWLEILDVHENLNFNAVIFQVSPTLDAVYKSKNRPWGEMISDKQGTPPAWAEDFDLVAWMIDETHKRGMEFHAWFNPYRVTHISSLKTTKEKEIVKLSKDNFARKNPDLVYIFDNKLYLDPGHDKVIKHITDTVGEFLEKYDVDAIHFDDYFYPYKVNRNGKTLYFGDKLEDRETFRKNKRGFNFIENIVQEQKLEEYNTEVKKWRSNNNDRMILAVKNTIDNYNKKYSHSVQWGISPFGIWEHKEDDTAGSNTPITSTSSKRDIYADTRKWVQKEQIDYIIPQIYWEFTQKAAPYGEITQWWTKQMTNKRTQLYIGHSSYKHENATRVRAWKNYQEIPNQLKFNNKFQEIKGSVFFGYSNIVYNIKEENLGVTVTNRHIKELKEKYFKNKVLVPPKIWLDKKITENPSNIKIKKLKDKIEITFIDKLENDTRFYVIYGDNNKEINSKKDSNIIKVIGRNKKSIQQKITLDQNEVKNKKYLGISIKDRAGVESKLIKIN
ncbi:MAG: glycoside hydrolase family 10 protein [Fusobacteriaceae bacterium]